MALTKLLENIPDESSKLKNISDERLGSQTKSLLCQNFYKTMSDLSKTLISHPGFVTCKIPSNILLIVNTYLSERCYYKGSNIFTYLLTVNTF